LLKIGDPQLLLAVHPVAGIASETVADMLWDEARADLPGDLRKKRSKLRLKLRRLVPDLPVDPLPGDAYKGEKVVLLDTSVVSSDVHEFIEVLDLARGLKPPDAIAAYEAVLGLYRVDLLDASDMRKYRWTYDGTPRSRSGGAASSAQSTKRRDSNWQDCSPRGRSRGWHVRRSCTQLYAARTSTTSTSGPRCSAFTSARAARLGWKARCGDFATPGSSWAPPMSPTSTACLCHPIWSGWSSSGTTAEHTAGGD